MLTYAKSDVSVVSYKIYDTDNKTILEMVIQHFGKVKGKRRQTLRLKNVWKMENISNGIVQ